MGVVWHHFAAIAGLAPWLGQFCRPDGVSAWHFVDSSGCCAGRCGYRDALVLFASSRRDGRSLGEMIRQEMGPTAGTLGMLGILAIVIILLAVLGMVVVKALAHSPGALFTIAATIPIALFMGIYSRYWRPGKVGRFRSSVLCC